MSKTNMIVGGVVALLIVGGLSYAVFGMDKEKKTDEVAIVPTVATVNGVSITRAAFDSQLASTMASLKAQGVDTASTTVVATIKAQVLNDLISNEVVTQELIKSGIKVSNDSVETQYQTILTQLGGADKLKEQLAAANLTETQLRENIAKQIAIQTFLLQNIASTSITVSDKEISDFYKDYAKANKDAPALKDLSAQIKQQITLNKQQVLVNQFIAELKAKAKIEASDASSI